MRPGLIIFEASLAREPDQRLAGLSDLPNVCWGQGRNDLVIQSSLAPYAMIPPKCSFPVTTEL